MIKILSRIRLRGERGTSLVIVAFAIVGLLGLIALVIDGGMLYAEKSKLQKALDAAVLGGAQVLLNDEEDPKAIAAEISQQNGYSLNVTEDLTVIDNTIEAKKTITVPMTFARVINITEVNVSAKAKAEKQPLKKARIAPIAIEESLIIDPNTGKPYSVIPETELIMKTGENKGNAGFLDLDEKGGGAAGLADAIKNGANFEIGIGDTVEVTTEAGYSLGDKVRDELQSIIDTDGVIFVVVVQTFDIANGTSVPLTAVGLAAFKLADFDNKSLTGSFIKYYEALGEIGEGSDIGDYNLYGVKLIE